MTVDHAQVRALHDRLVADDPVASAELARIVLPELKHRLSRRWPGAARTDDVHDAVVEVFVQYLRAPERYDPSRSSLVGWLQLQAHGDLTNNYRSPRRSFHDRRVALIPADRVETDDAGRNIGGVINDVHPSEETSAVMRQVLEAVTDPTDRRLLALIVDGDRSTTTAAALLGLEHLPAEEQQRLVKQHKDRIKAKVKRLLRGTP